MFIALIATAGEMGEVPNQRDDPPDWIDEFPVWGEVNRLGGEPSDLEKTVFESWPFSLFGADDDGVVYYLDHRDLTVVEYTDEGELKSRWDLPADLGEIGFPKKFQVSGDGDRFGLIDKGKVTVFTRRKIEQTVALEFTAFDLDIDTGELVVAQVPSAVYQGEQRPRGIATGFVVTFDRDGDISSDMLQPELPDGFQGHMATLAQRVIFAVDDDSSEFWVADVMRYRLRRLSPSGLVRAEIDRQEVDFDLGYDVEESEEPIDLIRGTPQTTFKSRSVPVIWDIDVQDGLLWVLIAAGSVTDQPILDVYDLSGEMLARLVLPFDGSANSMVMTEDRIWLFWTLAETRPMAVWKPSSAAILDAWTVYQKEPDSGPVHLKNLLP